MTETLDTVQKIKVILGGDFRDRWKDLAITYQDYCYMDYDPNECGDYEQQVFNLFEYNSFSFDENIHIEVEDF